jgi:hypothetical protein
MPAMWGWRLAGNSSTKPKTNAKRNKAKSKMQRDSRRRNRV